MKVRLTDAQWQKILPFLRTCPNVYIGREDECRRFLEAVLWIARSGGGVAIGFRLNMATGTPFTNAFPAGARLACLKCCSSFAPKMLTLNILSSTRPLSGHTPRPVVLKKKYGGQALGRSRGGFSTKIHIAVDALGNALRFVLTGGERHDTTQAESLIEDFIFETLAADKAYDSEEFVEQVADSGRQVVIPPRSNKRKQRDRRPAFVSRTPSDRVLHQQNQALPTSFFTLPEIVKELFELYPSGQLIDLA